MKGRFKPFSVKIKGTFQGWRVRHIVCRLRGHLNKAESGI